MKTNKSIAVLLAVVMLAALTAGCGIVKVIPAGTEGEYTGEQTFDASAEAAGDWAIIQSEIAGKAEDLNSLMSAGLENGSVYTASFSGVVEEYNTDSPKGYLRVSVDGVDNEIQVQVGEVYSGTTVRDSQTNKTYEDFTNQTEWSAYAKTVNAEVQTNVVVPLGDLSALVGKTVAVVGCFTPSGDTLVVTPVSLAAQ